MKNNSGCLCRGNLHDPRRILRTPPRLYNVVYAYVVATITMNHAAIAEPSSLPPSPQVAICTVSQCDIFRWAQAKQAVCVCVRVCAHCCRSSQSYFSHAAKTNQLGCQPKSTGACQESRSHGRSTGKWTLGYLCPPMGKCCMGLQRTAGPCCVLLHCSQQSNIFWGL